ncbi:uncharacterized protein DS421_5g140940 [Arachis hypogaea]|nr:uncharacterized protein DS421_5g140940 [Arachis hypogaea]
MDTPSKKKKKKSRWITRQHNLNCPRYRLLQYYHEARRSGSVLHPCYVWLEGKK